MAQVMLAIQMMIMTVPWMRMIQMIIMHLFVQIMIVTPVMSVHLEHIKILQMMGQIMMVMALVMPVIWMMIMMEHWMM